MRVFRVFLMLFGIVWILAAILQLASGGRIPALQIFVPMVKTVTHKTVTWRYKASSYFNNKRSFVYFRIIALAIYFVFVPVIFGILFVIEVLFLIQLAFRKNVVVGLNVKARQAARERARFETPLPGPSEEDPARPVPRPSTSRVSFSVGDLNVPTPIVVQYDGVGE
jgi:hypothetical protein